MKKKLMFAFIFVIVLAGPPVFAVDIYKVDPAHSTIGFKVRHMGISYVSGKFDTFEGALSFDGDILTGLDGKVDVNSINTAVSNRDDHLKSDDFFSAQKFPTMTFKISKVTQDGSTIAVVGDLTIRGATKIVVLQGEFGGFVDTDKGKKTGVTLEGEINRQDFGLAFNKLLEAGQAMVGNQVKITLELEAGM